MSTSEERTNGKASKPIEILLVEDNPGDVRLTEEAFKESSVPNKICIAIDGEEAMEFLRHEGKYADTERPDIVLLDLNLPKKNGREVLAEIRSDNSLKRIPVVVLTTSNAEEDIIKMYTLYANCYITKPIDFDDFMRVVKAIERFWLTTVQLPSKIHRN